MSVPVSLTTTSAGILFHAKGWVRSGTLAERAMVQGALFEAGSTLWFAADGKLANY